MRTAAETRAGRGVGSCWYTGSTWARTNVVSSATPFASKVSCCPADALAVVATRSVCVADRRQLLRHDSGGGRRVRGRACGGRFVLESR